VGIAAGAFFFLITMIVTGNWIISAAVAVTGWLLVFLLVRGLRQAAVRQDERLLAEQARTQNEVYEARRAAWERLTYCPTDRCVVDEVTGDARPLHAAHELLVMSTAARRAPEAPAEQ
jgi:hypothetical protein